MYSFKRTRKQGMSEQTKIGIDVPIKKQIKDWFESIGIDEHQYKINDDFTITVYGDIVLANKNLKRLPDFIKFKEVTGFFLISNNPWESAQGFPDIVGQDLKIGEIWTKKEVLNEIKKNVKIYGKLW